MLVHILAAFFFQPISQVFELTLCSLHNVDVVGHAIQMEIAHQEAGEDENTVRPLAHWTQMNERRVEMVIEHIMGDQKDLRKYDTFAPGVEKGFIITISQVAMRLMTDLFCDERIKIRVGGADGVFGSCGQFSSAGGDGTFECGRGFSDVVDGFRVRVGFSSAGGDGTFEWGRVTKDETIDSGEDVPILLLPPNIEECRHARKLSRNFRRDVYNPGETDIVYTKESWFSYIL